MEHFALLCFSQCSTAVSFIVPDEFLTGTVQTARVIRSRPPLMSNFQQDHKEVEDTGTGSSKSLFCYSISGFDGNLTVPWDSP